MSFLMLLTVMIFLITVISLINERFLKMPNDIALLLFSLIICVALKLMGMVFPLDGLNHVLDSLNSLRFESYLLDGVLCFMLFAGAGKVHFNKFTSNLKSITLLSFLTTAISAALFGTLFFVASFAFGWQMDIWLCILLGCIVSPTDPIAATGIMNKLGLSKNVTTVIESESLFNDGVGVALFVFVKSIVTNMGRENFVVLMLREILGATVVAFAISCVLLLLIERTRKPFNHILISILAVSSIYVICEICGFSGVIASVICGMIFSYGMNKKERYRQIVDKENVYSCFWEVVDNLLNSVLFVLIGLAVLKFPVSVTMLQIGAIAILAVVISRVFGVAIPIALSRTKNIPGGYNLTEYTALMTWSALKGGLSLALILSTEDAFSNSIYTILFGATYLIILFTVIVQGMTTKTVYYKIEQHKARRIQKENM